VPQIRVEIPFTDAGFTFVDAPAGGRGYYRTPSLTNIWTSAPFFHNNGLGLYNGRTDIAGRLEAFEDAATKLLSPWKRLGEATVRKTSRLTLLDADLPLGLKIPVLKGWSIDLFGNLGAAFGKGKVSPDAFLAKPKALYENFKEYVKATDMVQDKGHTFGWSLSAEDKEALIELMKSF
jgi:hypothetical protein